MQYFPEPAGPNNLLIVFQNDSQAHFYLTSIDVQYETKADVIFHVVHCISAACDCARLG